LALIILYEGYNLSIYICKFGIFIPFSAVKQLLRFEQQLMLLNLTVLQSFDTNSSISCCCWQQQQQQQQQQHEKQQQSIHN